MEETVAEDCDDESLPVRPESEKAIVKPNEDSDESSDSSEPEPEKVVKPNEDSDDSSESSPSCSICLFRLFERCICSDDSVISSEETPTEYEKMLSTPTHSPVATEDSMN
jgi:hypothetical protein